MAAGVNQAALDLLLSRHSDTHLVAPAPDDGELELIFAAARRVPDFRHLQPYRFLAARGDGLDRLGEIMRAAAVAAGKSEETVARAPRLPHRAPLVVIAVASLKADKYVSVFDQQLCAGCTVLTMQLAALALGYGGIWRSGWLMAERDFHRRLGLGEQEQIVGFLYLGTPVAGPAHETRKPHEPAADDLLTWL